MTISSPIISSLPPTPAVSGVAQVPDSAPSSAAPAADAPAGSFRTQLSKLGELMSKLQDLESSDPDKAKQVLSSIASNLADKAKADGGDPRLQALADRFNQAAQTGDLSAVRPHHGFGHHHHDGGGGAPPAATDGSTTATTGAASDPAAHPSSKAASYLQRATDRLAEVDSVISDALAGVTK